MYNHTSLVEQMHLRNYTKSYEPLDKMHPLVIYTFYFRTVANNAYFMDGCASHILVRTFISCAALWQKTNWLIVVCDSKVNKLSFWCSTEKK